MKIKESLSLIDWKTSISISATAFALIHLHANLLNTYHLNFVTKRYRKELANEGFEFKNGLIQLPTKSGLGIELNHDAVKKYTVALIGFYLKKGVKMAGKKIKVDFELQQDSIDMLDYFKDKYKLADRSKALRVILDYVADESEEHEYIYSVRRCLRCGSRDGWVKPEE